MSKLDELISKLCPDGVEYKKLSDVLISIHSGLNPRKNFKLNTGGELFYVTVKEITSGKIIFSEKTDKIDLDAWKVIQNRSKLEIDDVLLSGIGTIGKVAVVDVPIETWNCSESVLLLKPDKTLLLSWFLKYVLESKEIQEQFNGTAVGSTLKGIRIKDLEGLKIPVPPLPIQEEIVRILDNFTELTAELTAELQDRKKQYEYYKQKMFDDLKNDIQIKHITDIALVKARVGWQRLTTAEYLQSGDYYLVTGTDFQMDGTINFSKCVYVSKERYEMDENIIVHKDDILITKDGTLGKVALLNEEPSKPTTLNSGVFRIKINDDNVLPRFMYHYFTSKYFTDFVESVKTGSTIPHLTQQGLVSLDIPIPSRKIQEQIVNVLDNFEKICNDLKIGLPAEIELRQQQYEYYRDKLLNFKRLN